MRLKCRPGSSNVTPILSLFVIAIIFCFFIVCNRMETFKMDDPMLHIIREKLRPLHPEMVEKIVLLEDTKSYTINKKRVHLCLKDENGDYYHENMLTFVAIHELAHVLCDEIGHTDKFHSIFNDLLEKASSLQIYDSSIAPVHNYCEYEKN